MESIIKAGSATFATTAIQEPVSARLEFLIKNASEIANQLEATSERVFGSESTCRNKTAEKRAGMFGTLDELSYLMSEIMVLTNRISSGL